MDYKNFIRKMNILRKTNRILLVTSSIVFILTIPCLVIWMLDIRIVDVKVIDTIIICLVSACLILPLTMFCIELNYKQGKDLLRRQCGELYRYKSREDIALNLGEKENTFKEKYSYFLRGPKDGDLVSIIFLGDKKIKEYEVSIELAKKLFKY